MDANRTPRSRRGAGLWAGPAPLALACVLTVAAPGVAAAAAAHIFRLPSEPVERALLRFGVQGGVSVGGLPTAGCAGQTQPVLGLMTPAHALARLLPAGCGFEQLDAHTFRVFGRRDRAARPAPATEPSPPSPLDELIVTAEKRAEPLLGSPFPVSALPASEIARLGGRTFGDLAGQMVGVTVTDLGPGRDKIFLRGLSDGSFTGRTQSTVGLYLDDVPITYNAPDPDLRLVDVNRVEVLRGPQGTLYGSGSIGGVVHIVTASPEPGTFGGSVTAGAEATDRGAPSSDLEAVLNVPLVEGAALRGAAYSDTTGGYLDDPALGLSNVNQSRRWGARLGLLAALPDGWRLRASLVHQSIDTSDAHYTEGGTRSLTRDVQVREPSDNDFTEAGVSLAHSGGGADLKISAAFVDHVLDSQYDATGALPTAAPFTAPTAFGDRQMVGLGVVEAVATSTGGGRFRWLAGAFGSEASELDTGRLTVLGSGHTASVYRRRDHLQEQAVYGEASYDLSSRLTVTAGLRWFSTHRSSHADEFDLASPALPAMDGELTDRGLAPKIRFSYAFAPDVVVYAEAQKGFRAGGFNIPAAAAGTGAAPSGTDLPRFGSDRLWNYEVGGAAPLFDHRLSLRVALFHTDWTHLQTDQFLTSGLPMTVNIGDGENNGVEAEALWLSGRHWQVRLNVLLDDPQIVSPSSAFPAQADAGLPDVPNQLESLDVLYRWTPRSGLEADVSAQAGYVGRSHVTFETNPSALMGGYATARLAAELMADHWRLRAYIDNLTGETGDTFAFGNPFSRARGAQVTPLRPRTVGASLGWDF
ncbi:MAG: TonB-dependent receptor [Phenylobacterium sp.]|nr:MAG: TonB-dependent receptor [Phenylobacterium sp.]